MDNNESKFKSFLKRKRNALLLAFLAIVLAISTGLIIVAVVNPDFFSGEKETRVLFFEKSNVAIEDKATKEAIKEEDLENSFIRTVIFDLEIVYPNKETQSVTTDVPMINEGGFSGERSELLVKIKNIEVIVKFKISVTSIKGKNDFSYKMEVSNLPDNYTLKDPIITTNTEYVHININQWIDLTEDLYKDAEGTKWEKKSGEDFYDFTPDDYKKDEYNSKDLSVTFQPADYVPDGDSLNQNDLNSYVLTSKSIDTIDDRINNNTNSEEILLERGITLTNNGVLTIREIEDIPVFLINASDEVTHELRITFVTSEATEGVENSDKLLFNGVKIKKIEYKKLVPKAVEFESFIVGSEFLLK